MKLKLKWKIIFCIILFITFIFVLMKVNTMGLKENEYNVINKNLSSFYGLKIVHFSDLYYGKNINEKKLNKLVNMINDSKPDIVIFTGDLVHNKVTISEDISKTISNSLSKINSTYGKFYVNGDMDNSVTESILANSNFKSLDESYEVLYSKDNKTMFIGGININHELSKDMVETLNLNNYDYKILLSHYPDKIDNVLKYNFDLILSGHSLNGQFRLPGVNGIIHFKNASKYIEPYYKIENSNFYISNGIGSKINLRLFNTPSFNLYRLVDK